MAWRKAGSLVMSSGGTCSNAGIAKRDNLLFTMQYLSNNTNEPFVYFIEPDGSIRASHRLPSISSRIPVVMVAHRDHLYCINPTLVGPPWGHAQAEIWALKVDINGKEVGGGWKIVGKTPIPAINPMVVASGDTMHFAGGFSTLLGEYYDTIYSAPILDGTVGAFSVSGKLPTADNSGVFLCNESKVYFMGYPTGTVRHLYEGTIAGGVFGEWKDKGALDTKSGRFVIDAQKGNAYRASGLDGITIKSDVTMLDGYNGKTVAVSSLPTGDAFWASSAKVIGNKLYCFGGLKADFSSTMDIWVNDINTDGTLA